MRKVYIPQGCRECFVDGDPMIFHRLADEDSVLLRPNAIFTPEEYDQLLAYYKKTKVIPRGFEAIVLHKTYALVEDLDGAMRKVDPCSVTFMRSYDQAREWWDLEGDEDDDL